MRRRGTLRKEHRKVKYEMGKKMTLLSFPVLLPLLPLLLLSSAVTSSAASARCHADDEAGLLAFKSGITADPSGMLATWRPGTDCCAWTGVNCRLNSRVTELSLYGQAVEPKSYLAGTVSPGLARVRKLTGLYLVGLRELAGPFPAAIFHLPDLAFVYILDAKLSGPIPSDLGRLADNLGALSLAGNQFTGQIPESVARLTGLGQLVLSRNRLSGGIPAGLRQLRNLTVLSLDHNELSGFIPDLSPLAALLVLNLSQNQLIGPIPAWIAGLAPRLAYLELGHNILDGQIPEFLGAFSKLDTLDLAGNRLTGKVPASFKNLTKIFNLDLSGNRLMDPFPEMAVKGIESLDLSGNDFHLGTIPAWVAASPIIYSLRLAGCGIKMRMEDFSPVETYFYDYIDLSGNEITGSPAALLNRTTLLLEFRAAGNKLRFDMAALPIQKSLQKLDLSRNAAYGRVPAAVAGLKELNVSYNRLCGQLPPTKFPASSFAGNACLCGPPLPPCHHRKY